MFGSILAFLEDAKDLFRDAAHLPARTFLPLAVVSSGIAASATTFSIVDLVLFRPLQFPDAARLVSVYAVRSKEGVNSISEASWNRGAVSLAGWQALKASSAFEDVGAWARTRPVWGIPPADLVDVWYVSTPLLTILGARPILGRSFSHEEDQTSSEAVLLSYECWQRRYGARTDVLGMQATFTLFANEPLVKTIVGVLSPGIRLRGQPPEFFLPIGDRVFVESQLTPFVHIVGRLAGGVSLDTATTVAGAIVPRTLEGPDRLMARVVPLREDILGDAAPPAWFLIGSTAVLLLVVCASLGGWLLGEVALRQREIALRLALGATRRRILVQLMTEQSLRAFLAVVLGLVCAFCLVQWITALAPIEVLGTDPPALRSPAVIFGFLAVACTALLFGVGPALRVTHMCPRDILTRADHYFSPPGRRGHRIVVTAQLSLTLALLVCATVLAETFVRISSRPLGFDPSGLAVASIKVTTFPQVTGVDNQWPLFASWTHTVGLLESVQAVPGVVAAAGATEAVFAGSLPFTRIRVGSDPQADEMDVSTQVVTESYFQTMGIRLLSGRLLTSGDRQSGPDQRRLNVVISEDLARHLGKDPIGQRLMTVGASTAFVVVGVVQRVRESELANVQQATLYLLHATYSAVHDIVARTSVAPERLLPSIRSAIHEYDRSTLVTMTSTMEALVSKSVAGERFRAGLSTAFAGAALLLSGLAAYALGSRMVTDRRREIGIRAALGANQRDVTMLVFRYTAQVAGAAVLVGLPLSFIAVNLLRVFLVEVSPLSPHVYVTPALVLLAIVSGVTLGPARQAVLVDPVGVLRE